MSKLHTIKEIVDDLIEATTPEDVLFIKGITREKMGQFHHGMGTYIRNHYGLWGDNPLTEKWRTDESSHDVRDGVDYSLDHPDQVSMDILFAVWDKVNE